MKETQEYTAISANFCCRAETCSLCVIRSLFLNIVPHVQKALIISPFSLINSYTLPTISGCFHSWKKLAQKS